MYRKIRCDVQSRTTPEAGSPELSRGARPAGAAAETGESESMTDGAMVSFCPK